MSNEFIAPRRETQGEVPSRFAARSLEDLEVELARMQAAVQAGTELKAYGDEALQVAEANLPELQAAIAQKRADDIARTNQLRNDEVIARVIALREMVKGEKLDTGEIDEVYADVQGRGVAPEVPTSPSAYGAERTAHAGIQRVPRVAFKPVNPSELVADDLPEIMGEEDSSFSGSSVYNPGPQSSRPSISNSAAVNKLGIKERLSGGVNALANRNRLTRYANDHRILSSLSVAALTTVAVFGIPAAKDGVENYQASKQAEEAAAIELEANAAELEEVVDYLREAGGGFDEEGMPLAEDGSYFPSGVIKKASAEVMLYDGKSDEGVPSYRQYYFDKDGTMTTNDKDELRWPRIHMNDVQVTGSYQLLNPEEAIRMEDTDTPDEKNIIVDYSKIQPEISMAQQEEEFVTVDKPNKDVFTKYSKADDSTFTAESAKNIEAAFNDVELRKQLAREALTVAGRGLTNENTAPQIESAIQEQILLDVEYLLPDDTSTTFNIESINADQMPALVDRSALERGNPDDNGDLATINFEQTDDNPAPSRRSSDEYLHIEDGAITIYKSDSGEGEGE